MKRLSFGTSAAYLNAAWPIMTQRMRGISEFVAIIAALAACLVLPAQRATAQGQAATFTLLATFNGANGSSTGMYGSGANGLVQGSDGNFYGATYGGGANGNGTIFKMTPAGALTVLYSFSALNDYTNADGMNPAAALVEGRDGNFYGTTQNGGTTVDGGTIFKVTPAGALTPLSYFSDNHDFPNSGLILGTDGNLYGTTTGGANGSFGMVYKITPAGALTTLVAFNGVNGEYPAGLVQGSDGDFYLSTNSHGLGLYNDQIIKIAPSGTPTLLAEFSNTNGAGPFGALVEGRDGNFYGTTAYGGTSSNGTVFQVAPTGTLTILHNFSATATTAPYGNSDGTTPAAGLILGTDGNFYGTTSRGGSADSGTAFKITPAGALTTLYSFPALDSNNENIDGAGPESPLVEGRDGSFYGTTLFGGTSGDGTVYKITLPGTASPTTIAGISPATLQAGNLPFTLTVTGTGFSHGVTADFDGTVLTPAFAASTKLTFTVPAALVAIPGTLNVTVSNPGASPSNGLPFTITPGLTLARVSPASATVGSQPISITVTGSNFVNGCVVKWNGQPLPTYYLSPFTATATIPASYLATAGTAKITIANPHVYATPSLTFTVAAH